MSSASTTHFIHDHVAHAIVDEVGGCWRTRRRADRELLLGIVGVVVDQRADGGLAQAIALVVDVGFVSAWSVVGEDVTYTYDNVTAPNKGKGRLTGIADQTGSTALVYDERGNVTKETRTIAAKAHVVAYVYDLADRITQITYPSGRIVSYTRDTTGRITAVASKKNATAASVTLASAITYQPMSNLVSGYTYGNGLTETDAHTLDYEQSSCTVKNGASTLVSLTPLRTDNLNVTGITDGVNVARNQSKEIGTVTLSRPDRLDRLGHRQMSAQFAASDASRIARASSTSLKDTAIMA